MNTKQLAAITSHRLRWCAVICLVFALAGGAALAKNKNKKKGGKKHRPDKECQVSVTETQYTQINLVSDLPGAVIQDTNLVNAWGVSFTATGPFWVSSTERGLALVYAVTNDASGLVHVAKLPLEVVIPGEGSVTGQIFNNTGAFNSNAFLFVSEDGTISGWRPELGTGAEVLSTRSGAVYKGVTLIDTTNGPALLAANFAEGTLDLYGSGGTLDVQYTEPNLPAGYAPFNVQQAGGQIFVTFAKQDAEKEDDVPGAGNGMVDIFVPDSGTFVRFATGTDAGGDRSELNSPWGVTLTPAGFGDHGDQLLIGNFGSGMIAAFEADGSFQGLLKGTTGGPVTIDGLWALTFGNDGRAGTSDTLFFSAGPFGETHGLFGSLHPVVKTSTRNCPGGKDGDDDDDDDDDDNDDQGENHDGHHGDSSGKNRRK